jgi:hypothetical protein
MARETGRTQRELRRAVKLRKKLMREAHLPSAKGTETP